MDRQTVVMQLRPYRASDFEALYQIDLACFPAGVSYSRAELGEFSVHRNSNMWVAAAEEDNAGAPVSRCVPGRVGPIVALGVAAPWDRRGGGSALMAARDDWAALQPTSLIYLEPAEDNSPAQRFYAARGYEKFD